MLESGRGIYYIYIGFIQQVHVSKSYLSSIIIFNRGGLFVGNSLILNLVITTALCNFEFQLSTFKSSANCSVSKLPAMSKDRLIAVINSQLNSRI